LAIERLKLGEQIPMIWNSFDGRDDSFGDIYPQAELYDANDTLLGTFDLNHVSGSVWRRDDQTMPAGVLVYVIYKIYADSGHTVLNTNYQEMQDVFLKADAVATPGSVSIVERILGRVKTEQKVIGRIYTPKLVAKIKSVRLRGHVRQASKIQGRIKSQKIKGIVRDVC